MSDGYYVIGEDIIYVCEKCADVVDQDDEKCPSCGNPLTWDRYVTFRATLKVDGTTITLSPNFPDTALSDIKATMLDGKQVSVTIRDRND